MLVGIAGGSGSGKTTLARAVAQAFGDATAVVIPHDAYYRDLAHLSFEERARHNFDEPAALDNERLIADLGCLRRGGTIELPQYDFTNHVRSRGSVSIAPRLLVIVEGILVLAVDDLRALFDLRVFASSWMHRRRRGFDDGSCATKPSAAVVRNPSLHNTRARHCPCTSASLLPASNTRR